MADKKSDDVDHLQVNSAGGWTYRRRVPQDLIEAIGKREVKLALGTKDRTVAVVAAKVIDDEVQRNFEKLRKTLSDEREAVLHPVDRIAEEARRVADDAISRLRLTGDERKDVEP